MEVFALLIFCMALSIHYPQAVEEKKSDVEDKKPDEEYTVKIYHKKKEG